MIVLLGKEPEPTDPNLDALVRIVTRTNLVALDKLLKVANSTSYACVASYLSILSAKICRAIIEVSRVMP